MEKSIVARVYCDGASASGYCAKLATYTFDNGDKLCTVHAKKAIALGFNGKPIVQVTK